MLLRKDIKDGIEECEKINKFLSDETICFTGHRCQKLSWKFNENDDRCVEMRNQAYKIIENLIIDGYKNFISGMALGFDMICAEIVLELKNNIHI